MNIKKTLLSFTLVSTLLIGITGCASTNQAEKSSDTKKSETVLKIGATPLPHEEILEFAKPLLEKEGIKLEIQEFTDYVTPNLAINDGQLDANFFQHVPYMEDFNKNNKTDVVSIGKVHLEPLGAYSLKLKSIDEIANNSIVGIPNDATNEGRALLLLQSKGLIKLKDDSLSQTPRDIVENPKNLEFKEVEAAQLPRILQDVSFAIINTNYALEANLDPLKSTLFLEGADSPYANVISVKKGNEDKAEFKTLIKVLNSKEVKDFINEKYKGAVVPAF